MTTVTTQVAAVAPRTCIPFSFAYGHSNPVTVVSESLDEPFSKVYRKAMRHSVILPNGLREVALAKKQLSFLFPNNAKLTSDYMKKESFHVSDFVLMLRWDVQGMVSTLPVEVQVEEKNTASDDAGAGGGNNYESIDFDSI